MLRVLCTGRVAGTRGRLPGSGRTSVLLGTRHSSSQAATAEETARRAHGKSRALAGPRTLPTKRTGLYDPALEKDSCGVGLAVQMKSIASRQVKKCDGDGEE